VRVPNEEVIDSSTGQVVKPEGGISQNDIQTALAFNNGLTLMTLTRAELVGLLEHGVSAIPRVDGRFPQIAGLTFSYNPTLPTGSRVVNAAIVDDAGTVLTELVQGGAIAGDPEEGFRIVTLDFLAAPRFDGDGNFIGAGDGYPFPNTNTDPATGEVGDPAVIARVNQVFLVEEGVQTGDATFSDDGTEQDALAEYLEDNFLATPYTEADVGRTGDARIQNLMYQADTVFPAPAGDLNGDSCVDRADYTLLVAAIRGGSTDPIHDMNGDGAVSFSDARAMVLLFDNPRGAACTP
jgi:hypothetical protein